MAYIDFYFMVWKCKLELIIKNEIIQVNYEFKRAGKVHLSIPYFGCQSYPEIYLLFTFTN